MKKYIFLTVLLAALCATKAQAQFYGIKTNPLLYATGTMNAGAEVALAKQWSLDVSAY